MNVIPVINCPDAECARKKITTAKTFLPAGEFIHFDVTDGIFASHFTLSDPHAWSALDAPFKLEVHLMAERPEEYLETWLAAGMKRCIVHVETINPMSLRDIVDRCMVVGIPVMLSSSPDTAPDELRRYFKYTTLFQVLAVPPGAEGQEFSTEAIDKIRFIRENVHDAIIEVDGGMNPRTAVLAQEAGADTIVSSSYIFDSADPRTAYETLKNI